MSTRPETLGPIKSEFSDDPEMVELVVMFVDEMPQRVESMRTAFSESRFYDLGTLAHQIKGASGGYGFPSLGEQARSLEAAIKEDRAPARIREELDRLVDMCERLAA